MHLPILKYSRGYSLVELIIAVGISTIVLLGVSTLVSSFVDNQHAIRDTVDFDEEALRLQYYFVLPLRTAVNVQLAPGSIDNYTLPDSSAGANAFKGQLINGFDSKNLANDNTITTALLVCARDQAAITSAAVGGISNFEPMGIYFQQPSLTTFGVLYVNFATAAGNLAPSKSGSFSTNITRLVINDIRMDASNTFVTAFTVTVDMRYPTSSSPAKLAWCPAANPCAAGAPFKDIQRSFTVVLNNNYDPSVSAETQLGRVYFLGRGTL